MNSFYFQAEPALAGTASKQESKMQGYKTYIAAALTCGYAVFAFATGHMDANQAVQFISTAALGAGLRNAVANT